MPGPAPSRLVKNCRSRLPESAPRNSILRLTAPAMRT